MVLILGPEAGEAGSGVPRGAFWEVREFYQKPKGQKVTILPPPPAGMWGTGDLSNEPSVPRADFAAEQGSLNREPRAGRSRVREQPGLHIKFPCQKFKTGWTLGEKLESSYLARERP